VPEGPGKTALIIGASRGLGFGLVQQYLRRGWRVVGTERKESPSAKLKDAAMNSDLLEIEVVDINDTTEVLALRERLEGRTVDLLIVNAGIASGSGDRVTDATTDEFVQIMVTNALSPMRIVNSFASLLSKQGTIAVMSSSLASISNNTTGGWEVYRGSKAALNSFMRSFAARHQVKSHTLLLIAPGWARTDMGGPRADIDVETSVRGVADVIEKFAGQGGLHFVHYTGSEVSW